MVTRRRTQSVQLRTEDNLVPNTIAQWRKYRGVASQAKLAEMCGLPSQTISRLEAFTVAWTPHTLGKIAEALDCHPGDLVSRDPFKLPDYEMIWMRLSASQRREALKALKKIEGEKN